MGFQISLILVAITGFIFVSCQQSAYRSYLRGAIKLISRAKDSIPTCVEGHNSQKSGVQKAVDCADVLRMGHNTSGVYEISPMNRLTEGQLFKVYCDMDTDDGGWTVIQRRGDFMRPKEYFHKNWTSYKEGFGDLEMDFWLGNDRIYALTNQKLYSVRFDLEDFYQEKRFALYNSFYIDDENHKYTLHISNYSGNAGDAMETVNHEKFSTNDQDNDSYPRYNCAAAYKSGWWFKDCMFVSLNGVYPRKRHESQDESVWKHWKGYDESLAWTEIKIRPANFIR